MDEALLTRSALVSRVLPFSCVDGPGNLLVLFLQGCNFSCPGCHNPHTIGLCDDCGDCLAVCMSGALTMSEGKVNWQEALCTDCDACLEACPRSANPKTTTMTVADVLALLRHYGPLLSGITVSGGEATTRLPFVAALFRAIKEAPDLAHLSCLLDSNGSLAETGWQRLLPQLDGAMIDLKGWRDSVHLSLTGYGREPGAGFAQVAGKSRQAGRVAAAPCAGQERFSGCRGAARSRSCRFSGPARHCADPAQRFSPPRGEGRSDPLARGNP